MADVETVTGMRGDERPLNTVTRPMPWAELAGSEEFKKLTPERQEVARSRYFERYIAPRVSTASLSEIRAEFDKRTKAAPQRTATDTAKDVAMHASGVPAGEALLSMASGSLAMPLSGLAGYARTLISGPEKGAETVRNVQDTLTYRPQTEAGQKFLETATLPLSKIGELANRGGEAVADKFGPGAGAAAVTALQAIPMILGRVKALPEGAASVAARRAARAARGTTDAVAVQAREAGYVLPPSQANPSALNQILEGLGGKRETAQRASIKNQDTTNALARQALGIAPDTPLTKDLLRDVRKRAGEAYERVRSAGQVKTDPVYAAELDRIAAEYEGAAKSFPGLAKPEVKKLTNALRVEKFDAGAAIDAVKILREEADKAFRAGDKGFTKANKDAAAALEAMLDRHLTARGAPRDLIEGYRQARQVIAKTYTVEKALNEAGNVDASVLARELRKDKPLSGELRTIGSFGQTFKSAAQVPERMGGQPRTGLDLLTLASLRPMLREILTSGPYQRRLLASPSYARSGVMRLADLSARMQANPMLQLAEMTAEQEK